MELKAIPETQEIIDSLKPEFIKRYKGLLGDRYDEFIKYSFSFLRRSIRVNTLKIDVESCRKRLEKRWKLVQVPWCDEGFWIESERRDIGNTIEHALGYVYVQEAASMIPPLILDPKPHETVLDLAAAPGSKTSQMAAMMKNTGLLVANDIKPDRLKPLGLNVQRCGITNVLTTFGYGQRFKEPVFDRVLLDAPCSGVGNIRRSLKTVRIWNPSMITRLSYTQKELIDTAFSIVKDGGVLVYSTCTLEPQENEEVITHLLEKNANASLEKIILKGGKRSEPVQEFDGKEYHKDINRCIRLYPQDNDTEGFFVARIRKEKKD